MSAAAIRPSGASLNGTTRQPDCRTVAQAAAGEFRRERLPDPAGYYEAEGVRLSGRGAWRDAICPFHEDTRPSLRVHAETGAFKCMSCGARGGDVLDFHRRRRGLGFAEAAKALGAWRVR